LPGAAVGPLFATVIAEQFTRTRRGDRFSYENDPAFSTDDVEELHATTLSDVIRRNTEVNDIPDHAFFAAQP
jgi:peroxidase